MAKKFNEDTAEAFFGGGGDNESREEKSEPHSESTEGAPEEGKPMADELYDKMDDSSREVLIEDIADDVEKKLREKGEEKGPVEDEEFIKKKRDQVLDMDVSEFEDEEHISKLVKRYRNQFFKKQNEEGAMSKAAQKESAEKEKKKIFDEKFEKGQLVDYDDKKWKVFGFSKDKGKVIIIPAEQTKEIEGFSKRREFVSVKKLLEENPEGSYLENEKTETAQPEEHDASDLPKRETSQEEADTKQEGGAESAASAEKESGGIESAPQTVGDAEKFVGAFVKNNDLNEEQANVLQGFVTSRIQDSETEPYTMQEIRNFADGLIEHRVGEADGPESMSSDVANVEKSASDNPGEGEVEKLDVEGGGAKKFFSTITGLSPRKIRIGVPGPADLDNTLTVDVEGVSVTYNEQALDTLSKSMLGEKVEGEKRRELAEEVGAHIVEDRNHPNSPIEVRLLLEEEGEEDTEEGIIRIGADSEEGVSGEFGPEIQNLEEGETYTLSGETFTVTDISEDTVSYRIDDEKDHISKADLQEHIDYGDELKKIEQEDIERNKKAFVDLFGTSTESSARRDWPVQFDGHDWGIAGFNERRNKVTLTRTDESGDEIVKHLSLERVKDNLQEPKESGINEREGEIKERNSFGEIHQGKELTIQTAQDAEEAYTVTEKTEKGVRVKKTGKEGDAPQGDTFYITRSMFEDEVEKGTITFDVENKKMVHAPEEKETPSEFNILENITVGDAYEDTSGNTYEITRIKDHEGDNPIIVTKVTKEDGTVDNNQPFTPSQFIEKFDLQPEESSGIKVGDEAPEEITGETIEEIEEKRRGAQIEALNQQYDYLINERKKELSSESPNAKRVRGLEQRARAVQAEVNRLKEGGFVPHTDIEKTFENDFGISPEQLLRIEGFSELSKGEKELVLENFQQLTYGRIQEEVDQRYKEKEQEKEEEIRRKHQTEDDRFYQRMWQGAQKAYEFGKLKLKKGKEKAKIEAQVFNEIQEGGIEAHGEILEKIIGGVTKDDFEVHMNPDTHRAEVLYVNDIEAKNEEEQQIIDEFNAVANDYNRTPEEWGYEDSSRYERFKKWFSERKYSQARERLINLLKKRADGSEEEKEQYAMLKMNELDAQVDMNRFFNANADVEKVMRDIRDESLQKRRVKAFFKRNGINFGYMGGGFLTRMGASSAAGLLATSLASVGGLGAAAGVGAVRGRIRGWEELRKERESVRNKDEGRTSEEIKDDQVKRKELRGRINELAKQIENAPQREERTIQQKISEVQSEIEKIEDRLYQEGNLVNADSLSEKIERKITQLNETDENGSQDKKQKILNSLKVRLSYTQDKLEDGLVKYGKGENRVASRLDLMQAMSQGYARIQAENKAPDSQAESLEKRLNGLLKKRQEKIDKSREKYLRSRMKQSGAAAFGFAGVGYGLRAGSESLGVWGGISEKASDLHETAQEKMNNLYRSSPLSEWIPADGSEEESIISNDGEGISTSAEGAEVTDEAEDVVDQEDAEQEATEETGAESDIESTEDEQGSLTRRVSPSDASSEAVEGAGEAAVPRGGKVWDAAHKMVEEGTLSTEEFDEAWENSYVTVDGEKMHISEVAHDGESVAYVPGDGEDPAQFTVRLESDNVEAVSDSQAEPAEVSKVEPRDLEDADTEQSGDFAEQTDHPDSSEEAAADREEGESEPREQAQPQEQVPETEEEAPEESVPESGVDIESDVSPDLSPNTIPDIDALEWEDEQELFNAAIEKAQNTENGVAIVQDDTHVYAVVRGEGGGGEAADQATSRARGVLNAYFNKRGLESGGIYEKMTEVGGEDGEEAWSLVSSPKEDIGGLSEAIEQMQASEEMKADAASFDEVDEPEIEAPAELENTYDKEALMYDLEDFDEDINLDTWNVTDDGFLVQEGNEGKYVLENIEIPDSDETQKVLIYSGDEGKPAQFIEQGGEGWKELPEQYEFPEEGWESARQDASAPESDDIAEEIAGNATESNTAQPDEIEPKELEEVETEEINETPPLDESYKPSVIEQLHKDIMAEEDGLNTYINEAAEKYGVLQMMDAKSNAEIWGDLRAVDVQTYLDEFENGDDAVSELATMAEEEPEKAELLSKIVGQYLKEYPNSLDEHGITREAVENLREYIDMSLEESVNDLEEAPLRSLEPVGMDELEDELNTLEGEVKELKDADDLTPEEKEKEAQKLADKAEKMKDVVEKGEDAVDKAEDTKRGVQQFIRRIKRLIDNIGDIGS